MIHLNLSCLAIFRLAAVSHRHGQPGLRDHQSSFVSFWLLWEAPMTFTSSPVLVPSLDCPASVGCIRTCGHLDLPHKLYPALWFALLCIQQATCSQILSCQSSMCSLRKFYFSESRIYPRLASDIWFCFFSSPSAKPVDLYYMPGHLGVLFFFFWDRITLCSLD